MSKQSIAKKVQNYQPKPRRRMCSNCDNYTSDLVRNEYDYEQEKNVRCCIGGFAIKKTSTCDIHKFSDV